MSELTEEVRRRLRRQLTDIQVRGELTSLTRSSAGHLYFSLKDASALLKVVMFRGRAPSASQTPREGDLVVARGSLDVYAPRGEYQLVAERLARAGEGELREAYERLLAALRAEGLFDPARKKALPSAPRVVGVVTSPGGAALRDIIRVMADRDPSVRIVVAPAQVQGEQAPGQLVAALRLIAARPEVDVIILARGGGSLEDLTAFNDERLAREIFACATPLVSAVGHETDFSIADFVADVRAATPSHAAELVTRDRRELAATLESLHRRGLARLAEQVEQRRWRLKNTESPLSRQPRVMQRALLALDRLQQRDETAIRQRIGETSRLLSQSMLRLTRLDPASRIAVQRQRLDHAATVLLRVRQRHDSDLARRCNELKERLNRSASRHLSEAQSRHLDLLQRADRAVQARVGSVRPALQTALASLDALDPTRVLARGYAVVLDRHGASVTDAADLKPGDEVLLRLRLGSAAAAITAVEPSTGSRDVEA